MPNNKWSNLQKYSFYIGSPISIVACCWLLYAFYKYKRLNKPPGNLLILTILWEMFVFFELVYTSVNVIQHGEVVENTGWKIVGALTLYFWHLAWNYFTCLAFEIMYRMVRPTDLKYKLRFSVYNVLSHIPWICYVSYGIAYQQFGIAVLKGWLIKRGSALDAFFVIPFCIYFPMDIIFMCIAIFKAETRKQKSFIKRYLVFIIVYFIVQFPISAVNFLSWEAIDKDSGVFEDVAVVTLGFAGVFISLARFIDPQFIRLFRKRFTSSQTEMDDVSYIADPIELADANLKETIFQLIEGVHQSFTKQKRENQSYLNSSTISFLGKDFSQIQLTSMHQDLTSLIMKKYDIKIQQLIHSFDPKLNRKNLFSREANISGAGGQFIYFTHNSKFVLKLLSYSEYSLLVDKVFPEYIEHLEDCYSCICQIVGIFDADGIGKGRWYVIIMKNVITHHKSTTHIFDIKGSEQNRQEQKNLDLVEFNDLEKNKVYKDVDFNYYIGRLHLKDSAWIKDQLTRDIQFLENLDIMDYSILVIRMYSKLKLSSPNVFKDIQNPDIYYCFGIIDFLQQYTLGKQFEHSLKSIGSNKQVSSTDVATYARRLTSTVNQIIFNFFVLRIFFIIQHQMTNNKWDNVQKYSFFIGSPLSLISWIWLLYAFYKYKQMSKPPGNLIIYTILSEMVLFVELLYDSISVLMYGEVIEDLGWQAVGALALYFWVLGWNYFTCLAFEIMYRMLRPTDLRYRRRSLIYNILSHIPWIIYLSAGLANSEFGVGNLKTWFLKRGSPLYVIFVIPQVLYFPLYIIFMGIAIFKAQTSKQKSFIKRYLVFIFIYWLMYFPTSACEFIGFKDQDLIPNILKDMAVVTLAFCGVLVSAARCVDPQFVHIIRQTFTNRKWTEMNEHDYIADPIELADANLKDTIFQLIEGVYNSFLKQTVISFISWNSANTSHDGSDVSEVLFTPVHSDLTSLIMKKYGINFQELIESFDPELNHKKVFARSANISGAGGQFIYFTHDSKFVLKLLQKSEYKLLVDKVFPEYFEHLMAQDSHICKIIGIFNADGIGKGRQYLMIMQNVITHSKLKTHVFDIKGSEQNRQTTPNLELVEFNDLEKNIVYKDVDFNYYIGKLYLKNSDQIISQLVRDIQFLCNLDIMDYSILVVRMSSKSNISSANLYQDIKNPDIYYSFGIIDFLQQYTLGKQVERGLKRIGTNKEVSSTDVSTYARRLKIAVEGIFVKSFRL